MTMRAMVLPAFGLLCQRRSRAVVSRTFPLEGAEEAHALLRNNALVGRAALLLES
jgi:hypothetical protein